MLRSRHLWLLLIAFVAAGLLWTGWQFRNMPASVAAGLLPEVESNEVNLPAPVELKPATILSARFEGEDLTVSGTAMPDRRVSLYSSDDQNIAGFARESGAYELVLAPLPRINDIYDLVMQGHNSRRLYSRERMVVLNFDQPYVTVISPGEATRWLSPELPSDGVSLDVIMADYDDNGSVIFSGDTASAGVLRMRIGEALIGELILDAPGPWSLTAEAVLPPQGYVIEFTLLDDTGATIVTRNIQFERQLVPPMAEGTKIATRISPEGVLFSRELKGGGRQHTFVFGSALSRAGIDFTPRATTP